jgi:hypothetical protein
LKKSKKKVDKIQPGDAVLVVWSDVTGSGAWSSLHEEPIQPVTVRQVGFFLQKDKHTLHIAQGLPLEDCQVLGLTALPVGCILSLKKIKL